MTPQNWLLDIALDHLTLGRAALYAAILERSAALRAAATPNDPPSASSSDAFFPADAAAGHRPALPALQTARRELDAAVVGLRDAGDIEFVARALLTRAWCSFVQASFLARAAKDERDLLLPHTQEDLDEAWEIAERGPKKLFMADIHLHRARLFGMRSAELGTRNDGRKYPWDSPAADLAAAEKIIRHETKHTRPDGSVITARHARRDDELADARRALGLGDLNSFGTFSARIRAATERAPSGP